MTGEYSVNILPHRIHLTLDDCETLFGSIEADRISENGNRNFADTGMKAVLTGPGGIIRDVPVFSPLSNSKTEVLITINDSKNLRLDPPVCTSSNDTTTPGITIEGSKNKLSLSSGVFVPQRRIYLRPQRAVDPKLREGDTVFAAPLMKNYGNNRSGTRVLIFGDVKVLYSNDITSGFYIDEEEAAAAGLKDGDFIRILGKPATPEHRGDRYINKKKRLVTENDVRQAMMRGEKIMVESWMLVTPAARELGNTHRIFTE